MEFTEEHEHFRKSLRRLVDEEINPYVDEWEAAGIFPAHELFPKLGEVGVFGLEYDPEFGGGGADHSFTYVMAQELGRINCAGVPRKKWCRDLGDSALHFIFHALISCGCAVLARLGAEPMRNLAAIWTPLLES